MSYDVEKPDEEWRAELTPAEYAVLRQAGTEPAFTGEYTDTKSKGVYSCRACGAELFTSDTKFESHCGWPSFFDPKDTDAVELIEDRSHGMVRTEVRCSRCGSHLGHVFAGEGYPTPPTSGTASIRSPCGWSRPRADRARWHRPRLVPRPLRFEIL
ncbi:peptide-methionine (R)-S-oxide reductase [Streptomyces sp. 5112.2]|nr:peptide-methionine (R)-S-oxide reductase [Streptomyces sp. 5112.2]